MGHQIGLDMDDILCETPLQAGMKFLYPIILSRREEQKLSTGLLMTWSDVPDRLLTATGYETTAAVDQRSIWIREMKQGMSRNLVSQAFEQDICPVANTP
jgi:hypothetical protein